MPFPLPADPVFRKELAKSWIDDVEDRVNLGDIVGAGLSLNEARTLLLSLPPGQGDESIVEHLLTAQSKLEQHKLYQNENNFRQ